MQNMKTIAAGIILCCRFFTAQAQSQPDSVIAKEHALHFADSFVKANFYQDWKTYIALTTPSAIQYYGGKKGYEEHVTNLYFRNEPQLEEKPETVYMVNLANNDMDEWQCIIRKVRSTRIEYRKAKLHTFLIGKSTDNGETWTFVDVSHNSIENIIYIMPGIFDTLAIPERKTTYDDESAGTQTSAMNN